MIARTLTLALCSVLAVLPPLAQAVSKNDFAYGYSIEVDGDGAIYSLYLDEKIYFGLTREDRADLRIFNGHGKVVPHDIRRAEKMTRQKKAPVELPIFPLYKSSTDISIDKPGYTARITTNDQGAIIDLNYGKVATEKLVVDAYLIDASSLKQQPEMLTVNWSGQHTDLVRTVSLEGSNDLTHWHTLVARSTLSHLQHGKHTLLQKTVNLPRSVPKYLRLNWEGNESFEIDSIQFHFPETYHAQSRQWSTFFPVKVDAKNQVYYFNTNSVIPIDRVDVQLPERNTLAMVLIESAHSEKGPWYSRYHGLLYELIHGQSVLKNPSIYQPVHSHRHWRITLLNGDGLFNDDPVLRLGWIPEELVFVATGESPFTLAYGSARVGPPDAPLAQLLSTKTIKQQGHLIKPARLGSSIDFGDESRLHPVKPPVDWKRYLLWSILILGVIALAFMVLRLYKQMEHQGPGE